MNWKEFKDLLASGRHFYSPEVLERALGGELKKYAPIARDYRMRNQKTLGVVGYELLTGKPPFAAASVPELIMHHVTTPAPSMLSTFT